MSQDSHKLKNQSGGAPLWLISFTDVMALMLTFFVLLFSMSNPKQDVWSDITNAFDEEFNKVFGASSRLGPVKSEIIGRPRLERALDLNYLATLVLNMLEKYPQLGESTVETYDTKIIISLPSDLLFAPGSARVTPGGQDALHILGGKLRNIVNRIEVNGHTDPVPIPSGGYYTSNWELSLARASNVSALFYESGYQADIVVKGLADSHFYEIPATLDTETRHAKARRVEIVIRSEEELGVTP